MTYSQAVDFLFSRLPMFQRIGADAYKPGLENTYAFAQVTGNPHIGLKCIHVAGTNGKGSTSSMLASVFMELGWKTGLYTSPHLKDFRERIKINGKCIGKKYVVDFVETYGREIEKIKPSFFELTCVMAMKYFADRKTDIVIMETGMGGRLDSTNIIFPDVSVITNISKDHTQFLGNTLAKIAAEKAGIIKPGIPVVIGEKKVSTHKVFKQTARVMDAVIHYAKPLRVENYKSDLQGQYQQKNIRTVLEVIKTLNQNGYSIPAAIVKKGIANVVKNTGLQGRWQTISLKPHIICDIAHNEDGILQLRNNLRREKYRNLHIILGMVSDKDVSASLSGLPKNATYYFTNAAIPRSLPASELRHKAQSFKLTGNVYTSVKKAVKAASQKWKRGDLVLVTGSAFVVAEAL